MTCHKFVSTYKNIPVGLFQISLSFVGKILPNSPDSGVSLGREVTGRVPFVKINVPLWKRVLRHKFQLFFKYIRDPVFFI